jgi:hypothetical protein
MSLRQYKSVDLLIAIFTGVRPLHQLNVVRYVAFIANCRVIMWRGAEGDCERRDLQGTGEYSVLESFVIGNVQQIFLYVDKTKEELDGTRGACGPWQGNQKERGHLRNLGVDGRVVLNCTFKEVRWEIVFGRSLHTNAGATRSIYCSKRCD